MPVITISREVGSAGTFIGKRVADKLGYRFVNKDLIADVLEEYGLLEFERVYEASQGFWEWFDERTMETVTMLNKVIRALAHHGDIVIVGRGSFMVLGGLADVLNVRIQAPLAHRVQWVMEHEQIADREQADALVRARDRARAVFVEKAYNTRLDAASAFDLVIDTSKVLPERAVSWLVELVRELPIGEGEGVPTTKGLEVDPVLADILSSKYLAAS